MPVSVIICWFPCVFVLLLICSVDWLIACVLVLYFVFSLVCVFVGLRVDVLVGLFA